MPFIQNFGFQLLAQNAGKSLKWPSNVLIFVYLWTILYYVYFRQLKNVLDEHDSKFFHFRNCTSNCSTSFRTFMKFHKPLLPKNRTEQPWLAVLDFTFFWKPLFPTCNKQMFLIIQCVQPFLRVVKQCTTQSVSAPCPGTHLYIYHVLISCTHHIYIWVCKDVYIWIQCVPTRFFWQGNNQIHSRIQCTYGSG